MKEGFSAESPRAARSLPTATFTAWSKSPKLSSGQIRDCNSSRVTRSPGCSSRICSTLKGWSWSLMRLPDLRTSPEGTSASNAPKRIVRFPLLTVTSPFLGESSIVGHLFYRRSREAHWFVEFRWRLWSPRVSRVSPEPRFTVDRKASCCELSSWTLIKYRFQRGPDLPPQWIALSARKEGT